MPIVKIKDGLIEVDNKPYSTTEVFVHGKVTGEIRFSKSSGIRGEIVLGGEVSVISESPGILIIVENISQVPPASRLEALEHRKGLVVKVENVKRDVHELLVRVEESQLALSATFTPRKLVLYYGPGTLEFKEKPFTMKVYVRSPVVEQKAMVSGVKVE